MTLGHRVAVLKDGRLQQCDTPRVLYERPANSFVAGFIGSPAMNLCVVPWGANGSLSLGGVALQIPAAAARSDGSSVVVGLRPEALELAPDGLPAQVDAIEELGADVYLFCTADIEGAPTKLVARVGSKSRPSRGERIALRPRPDEAHVFDDLTGERLGGA
jgi:multiple sugar transport system ATP-binding protein